MPIDDREHGSEEPAPIAHASHAAPNEHVHLSHRHTSRLEAARSGERAERRVALAVACLGYLVLATRNPRVWGQGLWAALALLAVPAVAGVAAGLVAEARSDFGERLRRAAGGVGWAMGGYALVSMTMVRARMGSGTSSALLTIPVVAGVLAVAAGLVGGLCAAGVSRLAVKE
ncbi:MAG: hypothetical protein HZB16_15155 [Armatimonadetes bacterium]|nr:hypothetical protein [Armatimonadota bacterium]